MGSITDFDIPGSSASIASGINDAGLIVGYWMVENQLLVDSFERDAAGGISTFAAPTDNYGTFAASINEKDQVTGNWQDSIDFVYHGFVQKRDRLLCEKVSAACCLCAGAPAATPIEGSVAVIAHCVQGRGRSIQIAITAQS